jgi:hypothetical protein
MKTLATAAALLLLSAAAASAQVQPGPNLTPNGIPFTYSPRAGAFYLRRPPSSPRLFLPPLPAVLPAPPIGPAPELLPPPPPPAYAPEAPPPPAFEGPPPPPLGWVYTRYTVCPEPRSCPVVFVSVGADGLNVRTVPDGPPIMALVNGTPLLVLTRAQHWTLVAPACPLAPTPLWSATAGVPLAACAP